MNLSLIETFKSTKLNFQKLHFNWNIFCRQILEWFASQQKFSLPIEEQSKEELNRCLQVFYGSVRKQNWSEFKVSLLRAIRGAIVKHSNFFRWSNYYTVRPSGSCKSLEPLLWRFLNWETWLPMAFLHHLIFDFVIKLGSSAWLILNKMWRCAHTETNTMRYICQLYSRGVTCFYHC